jgi:hypothetical protein
MPSTLFYDEKLIRELDGSYTYSVLKKEETKDWEKIRRGYSDYRELEARFRGAEFDASVGKSFNRRDQEALRYAGRWDIGLAGYRDPVFNSENIRRFLQLTKLSDPIFDEIYKIADKAQKEMLRYSHAVKEFFIGEHAFIQYKTTGEAELGREMGRTLSYADRIQLIRRQS